MKKTFALLAVALIAAIAQPALADGRGYHHWGYGYGWLPVAAGAVVGGVVVGSMMQSQPVYAQPVYITAPQPRVIVQRSYYAPAPMYTVSVPQPRYYY